MLFLALSSLYYFKEYSRLFKEEKVKNRLIFSECQHINEIMKTDEECKMPIIKDIKELENTLFEIKVTFFIVLFLLLPVVYLLTMISLRPIRDSIRTIDNFISGVIHDINTPLSVIKLNSQSMQILLENEKLKDKNSRILQAVEDIESLEEQLLFSLTSDIYILNNTIVNLSVLLKNRLLFYNNIRDAVEIKLDAITLNIKVDSALFIRMIDNIVLNAIKFSPRNSEVLISIENNTLIIEDSGKGIKNPKEVFIKYYRENTEIKGLGLGLYIVKSVADLHNIEVKIESKLGKGTRFIIDLKEIKED